MPIDIIKRVRYNKIKSIQKKITPMTIYDIATQLKLSPATISMALNDDVRVALKTRERIRRFAVETGFKRNEQARNFRLKRTYTVAVVVYNIDNDFWSGVVKAIESEMGENYNVILCNTEEEFEKEKKVIAALRQRQVDGVIIQPVSTNIDHLIALTREGIPVVLFEKTEHQEMSFVKGDDFLAARNLTLKCIAAGHEKIVFATFKTEVLGVHDRIAGFLSACEEAEISHQCNVIEAAELSVEAVETAFTEQACNFTLAMCCDDRLACLLMRVAGERGIKVPDEMSVIGWNNSKFLDYLPVPLTSISIPVQEMGRNAARIILDYVAGFRSPVKRYVKEEITYRKSFRTRE